MEDDTELGFEPRVVRERLFKHKETGWVVYLVDLSEEKVSFCRQGGGDWVKYMKREAFFNAFVEMNEDDLREFNDRREYMRVEADGGLSLLAWVNPNRRWNGWIMPSFEIEEAKHLCRVVNICNQESENGYTYLKHKTDVRPELLEMLKATTGMPDDWDGNYIYITFEPNGEYTEYDYSYFITEHNEDGEPVKIEVIGIEAGNWCWSQTFDEEHDNESRKEYVEQWEKDRTEDGNYNGVPLPNSYFDTHPDVPSRKLWHWKNDKEET
tara:strand:+ start:2301 stop:3101 length:801 start_codon:yes stop_codon:yes gene_type:complete